MLLARTAALLFQVRMCAPARQLVIIPLASIGIFASENDFSCEDRVTGMKLENRFPRALENVGINHAFKFSH